MKNKRRIKKKEIDWLLSTLLISGGAWFIVPPLRDFISGTFNETISFFIGVGLILFALWRFDVI